MWYDISMGSNNFLSYDLIFRLQMEFVFLCSSYIFIFLEKYLDKLKEENMGFDLNLIGINC